MENRIKSFKEFYPFYLTEHQNTTSRRLHFIGTSLFFIILIYGVFTAQWNLLWLCPIAGYGFAWVGHFFFEKNKPATFKYPLWSLLSDFKLYFQILAGKQRL
jgi:hypothetical protein